MSLEGLVVPGRGGGQAVSPRAPAPPRAAPLPASRGSRRCRSGRSPPPRPSPSRNAARSAAGARANRRQMPVLRSALNSTRGAVARPVRQVGPSGVIPSTDTCAAPAVRPARHEDLQLPILRAGPRRPVAVGTEPAKARISRSHEWAASALSRGFCRSPGDRLPESSRERRVAVGCGTSPQPTFSWEAGGVPGGFGRPLPGQGNYGSRPPVDSSPEGSPCEWGRSSIG